MSLRKMQKTSKKTSPETHRQLESINGTHTAAQQVIKLCTHLANTSRSLAKLSEREKEMCFSYPYLSLLSGEKVKSLSVSAGSAVTESTTPLQGERGHPAAPLHRRHQPLDSLGLPCPPSGTLTLYYKLSGNCGYTLHS